MSAVAGDGSMRRRTAETSPDQPISCYQSRGALRGAKAPPMIINEWVTVGAGVLAICLAVVAWRVREAMIIQRSARMENYLRLEREAGRDRGQRSTEHLMAKLRMTARQVLEASKRSPAIRRLPVTASFPGSIFADSAMFEYAPFGAQGRNAI